MAYVIIQSKIHNEKTNQSPGIYINSKCGQCGLKKEKDVLALLGIFSWHINTSVFYHYHRFSAMAETHNTSIKVFNSE